MGKSLLKSDGDLKNHSNDYVQRFTIILDSKKLFNQGYIFFLLWIQKTPAQNLIQNMNWKQNEYMDDGGVHGCWWVNTF